MNVRISEVGRKILNDRKLSSQIASAIMNGKGNFEKGEPVNVMNVGGSKIGSVKLVTSMKNADRNSPDKK